MVAASPDGGGAEVVVPDARVAAVPRAPAQGAAMVTGGLVVLAVTAPQALALAGAAVSSVLSVVLRR